MGNVGLEASATRGLQRASATRRLQGASTTSRFQRASATGWLQRASATRRLERTRLAAQPYCANSADRADLLKIKARRYFKVGRALPFVMPMQSLVGFSIVIDVQSACSRGEEAACSAGDIRHVLVGRLALAHLPDGASRHNAHSSP